jgi:hypothetical protein
MQHAFWATFLHDLYYFLRVFFSAMKGTNSRLEFERVPAYETKVCQLPCHRSTIMTHPSSSFGSPASRWISVGDFMTHTQQTLLSVVLRIDGH